VNEQHQPSPWKKYPRCAAAGFVFPSSEIYGGLSGCWDYGPLGIELKRQRQTGMVECHGSGTRRYGRIETAF